MLYSEECGGYSSVAERRSVAADVVGSKPTSRPKHFKSQDRFKSVELASSVSSPKLFAGTSGWAYPTWKPGFYPTKLTAKNFLSFYASQLTSVEVNYTFRTLPTKEQLEGWIAQTGDGFRFSFKAPQAITHFARLRDCHDKLEEFLEALKPAKKAGKLGLLLFQLPPNFKLDLVRLQTFLKDPLLTKRSAPSIAFEFRHESWFCEETYAILRRHKASLCIAETDDLRTPEIHTSRAFTSFRLRRHGGYTPTELAAFAARFSELAKDRDVYVYFKHEDEPTGALNAAEFLALARGAWG
jgi:uncharacterized protein YecE (DUF72 family)